jgi:dienelactone hydrolase
MTKTTTIEYEHDGNIFEAYVAAPTLDRARPAVMICHAWAGRSEHEEAVAHRLAELGYVGIALDLYGKGVRGEGNEECQALMTPLLEDRAFLQERIKTAIAAVHEQDYVQADNTVIAGYCFGGVCALDAARSNAPVLGAASFHGLLGKPGNTDGQKIAAKVIIFHGFNDPFVPSQDLIAFADEMTEAGADWQIHAYGNTMHAFTNKAANDPGFGTVYSERADRRSFESFNNFLEEVLRHLS